MADTRFKSRLAGLLSSYMEARRSAGHSHEVRFGLKMLDRLMASEFPDAPTLTREAAERWISFCKEGRHINSAISMTNDVRAFAKYLAARGIECATIPRWAPGKYVTFVPHVATLAEMQAFFKAADAIRPDPRAPFKHLTAPVVFRLMACTGMRTGEARRLGANDVDLKSGIIRVLKSKAHAERVVMADGELLEDLRRYDSIIQQMCPRRTAFFISSKDGGFMAKNRISGWFHLIWDRQPEASANNDPPLCTRSFRHFYATERIRQWHLEGRDLNAMRPYLMCYMGHVAAESTDYYIHLACRSWGSLEGAMEECNLEVLPPLGEFEENGG